jgi:crotonobetainyl-CoA:carnitine CoA-transferase CaiB-like acyl-CoA transferase
MCWDALRTKPYAEWEEWLLADDDIAFEMARTSEEGLDHAQIVANGEMVTVEDPAHGPIRQLGPIAHLRDRPHGPTRSAPELGVAGGPIEAGARPAAGGSAPEHALSGLTIIELGYFYAMPFGVTMTAAHGARVIKIEGLAGDPMRNSFVFPEVGGAKTMEGKESLAIDLGTDEGRKIMHQLAANADVFVNGFRPGVAERQGLGYDTLKEVNPDLLYVHAAGYGVEGPYAHRPIYAGVASAVAGQITRHAGSWLDPELTKSLPTTVEAQAVVLPRIRGPVDGDANAALAVLSTLALGIFHQRRTGEGCWISTTMIGGNAAAYSDDFVSYRDKQPLPVADPEMHGLHALYRLYEAESGWVFVAAPRQKEWEALAKGLGAAELVDDERFRTDEARRADDDALTAVLAALLATKPAQEWEDQLTPDGVAVVKAFDAAHSAFTISDPVMRETGLVVQVESPVFGPLLRAAPPVRFSETPGRAAPGCTVGQHTRSILAELGYDDEAIDGLVEQKVVGVSD